MHFNLHLASALIALTASFVAAAPTSSLTLDSVYEAGFVMPPKEDLERCVDEAAKQLGLDKLTQTEPALLRDILHNDMNLDGLASVKQLLQEDLASPKPLGPLLAQVRTGLTDHKHHPNVGLTVCVALRHPAASVAFARADATAVKRTIHHMYLLEKIVTKLSDDKAFLEQVKAYVDTTVQAMVAKDKPALLPKLERLTAMFKAAGWFGVSKDATVKMAIERIIKFRNKGSFNALDVQNSKMLLTANILEATATDGVHGYKANEQVGRLLSVRQPTSVQVIKPHDALRYGLSDDWARVYETWNLAFITGNLEYLNMLYPKLLTPRVVLADGPAYIYERAIALWLSVNFYLMAGLRGVPQVRFPGQEDFATLMGGINLKYTNSLIAAGRL